MSEELLQTGEAYCGACQKKYAWTGKGCPDCTPDGVEQQPAGDPGRSLTAEVTALRTNVAQLCTAVRGLVTLISVLDKKVDAALKGGPGKDMGCM